MLVRLGILKGMEQHKYKHKVQNNIKVIHLQI